MMDFYVGDSMTPLVELASQNQVKLFKPRQRWLALLLMGCLPCSLSEQSAGHSQGIVAISSAQVTFSGAVPVVNIGLPNDQGVSLNPFNRFDVDAEGVVLNNSPRFWARSQFLEPLLGNPQLKGQSAKIILTEVRSKAPTKLQGYIEIAGDPADFIITNPQGIQCDGCGWINVKRGTLSTGNPILSGNLEYWVRKGVIEIGSPADGSEGLDARNTEQIDLISRAIALHQPLYGQQINLNLGPQHVEHDDLSSKPIHGDKMVTTGFTTGFGLISAQSITVKSSTDPLEITGEWQAEHLHLRHQDQLTLAAKMISRSLLDIESLGEIKQRLELESPDLRLKSEKGLQIQGRLKGHQLELRAPNLTLGGTIEAKSQLKLQGRLIESQGEHSSINWDVQAHDIRLQPNNSWYSRGMMYLQSPKLGNRGWLLVEGDLDLDDTHIFNNSQGRLKLGQRLHHSSELELTNVEGDLQSRQPLNLSLKFLENRRGNITSEGALNVHLTRGTLSGFFKSASALSFHLQMVCSTRALSWESPKVLINSTSSFINDLALPYIRILRLIALRIENQAHGVLRGSDVQLEAQETVLNAGVIESALIQIQSRYLENQHQGVINASEAFTVKAKSLNNRPNGRLYSGGEALITGLPDASGHSTRADLIQNRGIIKTKTDLIIQSHLLKNLNTHYELHTVEVQRENITVPTPKIDTAGEATPPDVTAGTANYTIYRFLRIATEPRVTKSLLGQILTDHNLALSGRVINDKSIMRAGLNIKALDPETFILENIRSPLERIIQDSGTVETQQGGKRQEQPYTPPAVHEPILLGQTLANDTSRISLLGHGAIQGDTITLIGKAINNSGLIYGAHEINLQAHTLRQFHGELYCHFGKVSLQADQDVETQGTVIAQQVQIEAKRDITHAGGLLNATGNLTMKAGRHLELLKAADYQDPDSKELVQPQPAGLLVQIERPQGVQLQAGHHIELSSGQHMTLQGAQLKGQKQVQLMSGSVLSLKALETLSDRHSTTKGVDHGFFSTEEWVQIEHQVFKPAIPNTLKGQQLHLLSQSDLQSEGSQLEAENDVLMAAGGQLQLSAAHHHERLSQSYQKTASGFSISWNSLLIGKQSNGYKLIQTASSAVVNQIQAKAGQIRLIAQGTLQSEGTGLNAAQGIEVTGQSVEVKAAEEHSEYHEEQFNSKKGISTGYEGRWVEKINQIRGALGLGNANTRALQIGHAAYGMGVDTVRVAKDVANLGGTWDAVGRAIAIEARMAIGVAEQSMNTDRHVKVEKGSVWEGGQHIVIDARDGDLSLVGSQLDSDAITLKAAKALFMRSAQTEEHHETYQNQFDFSISAGLSLKGLRGGWEVKEARQARTQQSLSHQAARIEAKGDLVFESGQDSRLVGVQVKAEGIQANVKGQLTVESVQDTLDVQDKSEYLAMGARLPLGVGLVGIQFEREEKEIETGHREVKAQSYLEAGKGGYQLQAEGIQLTGARLQSEGKTEAGDIELKHLENKAYEKSEQWNFGLNTEVSGLGLLSRLGSVITNGLGITGGTSKQDSSKTLSGVNIKAYTAHLKSYDARAIIDARDQAMYFQALGMEMSGDVAGMLQKKHPEFGPGGWGRTGLHAGVAGTAAHIGDGHPVAAAVGVMTGDLAGHQFASQHSTLLKRLPEALASMAINLVSGFTGAVFGHAVGGENGASWGASAAFDANRWNDQLHVLQTECLGKLQQGQTPEKQKRLADAACFMQQCGNVHESDKQQPTLKAMYDRGKHYHEEQVLLEGTGLFRYTPRNWFNDRVAMNQKAIRRIQGCGQVVLGTAGVAGSLVASPSLVTGISCVASASFAMSGLDKITSPYISTTGQEVLNSFNIATHLGDKNRMLALGVDIALDFSTALVPLWATVLKPASHFSRLYSPKVFDIRPLQQAPLVPRPVDVNGVLPKIPKLDPLAGRVPAETQGSALHSLLKEMKLGNSKSIAGKGAEKGEQIYDIDRLLATYGGKAADWSKVTSKNLHQSPEGIRMQVHAYENKAMNIIVDEKLVFIPPKKTP